MRKNNEKNGKILLENLSSSCVVVEKPSKCLEEIA